MCEREFLKQNCKRELQERYRIVGENIELWERQEIVGNWERDKKTGRHKEFLKRQRIVGETGE